MTLDNSIYVRLATVNDSDTIASLHAASWRTAYKGILSDEYLGDSLDHERLNYWRQKLERLSPADFVLVAEIQAEPVGFIAVLDRPEAGIDAFIDNLHARPDKKKLGIGSALMKEAALRLREQGKTSVYLFVLVGNTPAEGFYLAKGARIADTSSVSFGGKVVQQRRFVWDSLGSLLDKS